METLDTLTRFIKVYDGALADEFCDKIVSKFEANEAHRNQVKKGDKIHRKFAENKLSNLSDTDFANDKKTVINSMVAHFKDYIKRAHVTPQMFYQNLGFEEIRIKKYSAGTNDQFASHIDNGYTYSKRWLVSFFYLTDVADGGETVFDQLGLSVSPKKGRLLMFPSNFCFLHSAKPPISHDKYILGSYFSYVADDSTKAK